jgi:hypothetical protein
MDEMINSFAVFGYLEMYPFHYVIFPYIQSLLPFDFLRTVKFATPGTFQRTRLTVDKKSGSNWQSYQGSVFCAGACSTLQTSKNNSKIYPHNSEAQI